MTKAKKNRWLTLALATALVLAAGAAWAQPRGGEGRFGPPGRSHGQGFGPGPGLLYGPIAERLELSDEQRETLRGLFESHREMIEPWQDDLGRFQGELEAAIEAEPFDEEAVRALASQAAEVRVELAVARARVAQEVRAVLTPDQRETLGEMRARREEFRDDFRGRGGHGRSRRGPAPGGR